jgi:5-methylcytosine-specific restriction endonuclease McrA
MYGRRWQKARLLHLAKHPLCNRCQTRNVLRAAAIVDHVTPHRGDLRLFWDESNWQSLCKLCHDSDKQRQERLDQVEACDINGYPKDGW